MDRLKEEMKKKEREREREREREQLKYGDHCRWRKMRDGGWALHGWF